MKPSSDRFVNICGAGVGWIGWSGVMVVVVVGGQSEEAVWVGCAGVGGGRGIG